MPHALLLSATNPRSKMSREWLVLMAMLPRMSKYVHMMLGSVLNVNKGLVMCMCAVVRKEAKPYGFVFEQRRNSGLAPRMEHSLCSAAA